jgi:filamentous hemagglutinin family protein
VALPLKVSLALVAACLLAAVVPRVAAAQNITTGGRTLVGPNYVIGANLGKQVGSNLFHSFGQFSLSAQPTPESATFTSTGGTGPINNVIGRVTGGSVSSINGAIQSSIAGANLYLINPSGVVFGPNATVKISGSFHASTADYVKMSDGAKFQATNPDGSTLSAAPPVAFGFLTPKPAAITVNGGALAATSGFSAAQTLGLVAGPISITGASLAAQTSPPPPSNQPTIQGPGTIHVTSVAGTGEVPVDPRNSSALTVTSFGPVSISRGSTLSASNFIGLSGGSVFIRSGALTIDASIIAANNFGSGSGGMLVLRGDNQVTLSNGASVQGFALGSGNGAGATISTAPAGIIRVDASTVTLGTAGSGNGGSLSLQTGQLTLSNGAALRSLTQGNGNGGPITINAGSVLLDGGAALNQSTGIFSNTLGVGRGGSIAIAAGLLTLHNSANVLSESFGTGAGGGVAVSVGGSLTLDSGASLGTTAFARGSAGNVSVAAAGPVTVDMSVGALPSILDGIGSFTLGSGNAGNVTVTAGAMALTNSGEISSATLGAGNSGDVIINVSGRLSVNGLGGTPGVPTAIYAPSFPGSSGGGGSIAIIAGQLAVTNGGLIGIGAFGNRNGSVSVNVAGLLSIDGSSSSSFTGISTDIGITASPQAGTLPSLLTDFFTGVSSASMLDTPKDLAVPSLPPFQPQTSKSLTANGGGIPGNINLRAGTLFIANGGEISAATSGSSKGADVAITVAGGLSIDGTGRSSSFPTGITSQANPGSTGDAGRVSVSAGNLTILGNGKISAATFGRGNGGDISVTAGDVKIDGSLGDGASVTGITSQSFLGDGKAGSVTISGGTISIVNRGEISAGTFGRGNGGAISVAAETLTIDGTSGILSVSLAGTGTGGDVRVAAGSLSIRNDGLIASGTFGPGNGGSVLVNVAGQLSIDSGGQIIAVSGGGSGSGGDVIVRSANLAIRESGVISSETFGPGSGGNIFVTVSGELSIDANAGTKSTGILATATDLSTGTGGNVTINSGTLTILNGGVVSTERFGSGHTGSISVSVAQGLSINESSGAGTTGILARSEPGSAGSAGNVVVDARTLSISGGGQVSASTQGSGAGGDVEVKAQGALTLTDPGTGITASTTSTASGNAGSVMVTAPQIMLARGAEISSTTAGTGSGGSVTVTTPGGLVLDGGGDPNTQIAASAIGPESGPGGSVTVGANSLTIEGGAQIASSTAGPGKGGDVNVTVASDVVLPDPEPEINARSTGSGDAGSITVSAVRLLMNNGAAISTEAETSTASGGNITLKVRDFLHLVGSEITTSVKGKTGNGGNITIDPQLVILDHSRIIAEAIEGHGGNIRINAGEFIASADSSESASSQLGISGTVEISGPRVDVNGALVVLASELRGLVAVQREACAARAGRPISTLVEAGRGGLPLDPEATLPALYIAGRDVNPNRQAGTDTTEASSPLQTTVRLTMRCG